MIVVPAAYFGNIEYYRTIIKGGKVVVEAKEHYPKQSYRNRTLIMSANGVIPIIAPIKRSKGGKQLTCEAEIDYSMPWQRNAWRAVSSAYRNSAYFEHYEGVIKGFFETRYDTLIEMNSSILTTTLELLGVNSDISFSDSYVMQTELESMGIDDYREHFSPKKASTAHFKEYYQVFSDRLAFAENLSILDLLFCEGNNAVEYII